MSHPRPDDPYRHVEYLWDDAHAATLDPVERLVYRSNLLGSDQRITNTGAADLVFDCLCSPRFLQECYTSLE